MNWKKTDTRYSSYRTAIKIKQADDPIWML